MKLWKLVSIVGGKTSEAISISATRMEWEEYGQWLSDFDQLVNLQDRTKLDHELPVDFIQAVLNTSHLSFFVSTDNTLRSRYTFPSDRKMSAVEAFDKFGSDAIEEALESGSFKA